MTWTLLADIALGLAILLNAVFLTRLMMGRAWRRRTGLFLVVFCAVLEVLMPMRLVSRRLGPLPEWAWALGFLALDVVFGWLLWLLLRGRAGVGSTP